MTDKLATRIIRLDPRKVRLLDHNARFMTPEQFQRLVDNIRRDGCLTSVPLVCRDDDGEWLVLSGNHRTKAAIAAELAEVDFMAIDAPLDQARRLALQLSHNAITGQDDEAVLAELYQQIDDIDWRAYTGLDDKTLDLLEQTEVPSMSEANLDFSTLTIVFLPTELDDAREAVEAAMDVARGADELWAARLADHERILDLLDIAGKAHGVTNLAVGLSLVLDVAMRHLTDFAEGWYDPDGDAPRHKGWVPITTLLGWHMPAEAAQVVRRALDRIQGRGEASSPWQALEFLAADYLAGDD